MRAKHYTEKVVELIEDNIIQDMTDECPNGLNFKDFGFITGALAEYKKRGGNVETHIGGPAEAIEILKKTEKDEGSGLYYTRKCPECGKLYTKATHSICLFCKTVLQPNM